MPKDTDELKKKEKKMDVELEKDELLDEKKKKFDDKKSNQVKNKSVQDKVIENIKSFISKIIEMQQKVKEDEEDEKKQKEEVTEETLILQEKKYIFEYYDLPYRYNETVVKILAQTPKRLFVYWDISDKDKQTYLNAFGEHFFEDTYPVLLVHNENKNYTSEVAINDFANSWYLDISDPRDKYTIQLGRKFKTNPQINPEIEETNIVLNNDYLFIAMSNKLEVPNDHILFEEFKPYVRYRNVKTREEVVVDVTSTIYRNEIKELYNKLYDGKIEDEKYDMLNPSSLGTSGNFRINQ